MRWTVHSFTTAILLLELAKALKAMKNLDVAMKVKNPDEPFAAFDPAKMPDRVDIQLEGDATFAKTIYHALGAAWWGIKRDIANEKLRVHANYFQHETEVTQFKRKLDEDD